MAKKMRIELNSRELRRLLQTEGLDVTRKVGEKILAIVGTEHYEMDEWVGRNRGRVTIRTKPDGASMGHEAKYHNLIRALGSIGTGSSRPGGKIKYTSKSGKVSYRTQAEINNYRSRS